MVLGALSDPESDSEPLAYILNRVGVGVGQLLMLYRDAVVLRAQVEALGKLAEVLPAAMADLMSYTVVGPNEKCQKCSGTGMRQTKKGEKPCHYCDEGHVQRGSDLDRQKVAFEIAGLLKKGGGAQVQIVNQTTVGGFDPRSFQLESDAILHSKD